MRIIRNSCIKKVTGYCFVIFDNGGCGKVCSNNCKQVCSVDMGVPDEPEKCKNFAKER